MLFALTLLITRTGFGKLERHVAILSAWHSIERGAVSLSMRWRQVSEMSCVPIVQLQVVRSETGMYMRWSAVAKDFGKAAFRGKLWCKERTEEKNTLL